MLNPDSRVCLACAGGDHYIAEAIERDGEAGKCAICGSDAATLAVSDIANMVDDVFEKYVTYTGADPHIRYDRSTPNELVQHTILGCDDEALTDAIVEYLHDLHEYDVVHDGAPPLFEAHCESYVFAVPHTRTFDDDWERFEQDVKHRGRFYLSDEKEYLDRIFRRLLNGELHRGTIPTQKLGAADSQFRTIYRARVANTSAEQARILENPTRELAPPPPTLRTAGRMNAAGVVAFYGATDIPTCLAELAVPFGGAAVVGQFSFEHPVTVLDFRLLSRSMLAVSPFDPDYAEQINYARFMRRLRNLLRKPVFPGTESLEYLPTQMVGEYLAEKGLDGVMFVSSVTPEAREEADMEDEFEVEGTEGDADIARTTGINIVLFAHAAIVTGEQQSSVRRVIKVNPLIQFREPYDNWLYVETAPLSKESEPATAGAYPMFDDAIEPTLTLPEDEIYVAVPTSIRYLVATAKPTFSDAQPPDDTSTF